MTDPNASQGDCPPRRRDPAPGSGRGSDGRGRRGAQGDGLCHGGRAAGGGRSLYRPGADGHLCPAGLIQGAQRQFDGHARHPGRHPTRTRGPGRRPGPADHRGGDPDGPGRPLADAGRGAAPGVRRQLYLDPGADRLQGGYRARHCARPGAEAARRPFRKGGVFPRPAESGTAGAGDLPPDLDGGSSHHGDAHRAGALVAAVAGPAGRGGRCHRRHLAAGPARTGCLYRRAHPPGAAVAHPARSGLDRTTAAGRPGHRADELHRVDRGGARLRRPDGPAAQCQPGVAGDRGGQSRWRAVRRHAGRGRHLPDGGGARGRRAHADGHRW